MTIPITAEPVPLRVNIDGVALIGGTRVTLDTVATAFDLGATAEEICLAYTSLQLADIYAVISYYLRHHQDIEAYLQQRQQYATEIRQRNEAKFDPQGVRARLMVRKRQQ